MPIKTKNGKWKWGNVERSSKKELVQTVYGIWKKNGSRGSFSDFLKGTHESVVSEKSFKLYAYDIDTDKLYFHGTKLEVESFKSRPPTPDNIFYVAQDIKYAKKYGKNIYAIKLSENLKPFNISDEKCWKDIENNFPKFVYHFWVYGNTAYLDGFTKDGKLKAKKGKYSPVDLLSLAVRLYPTTDDYPYYSAIDWDEAVPEKFRKDLKKDYEDYKEWLKQNGFNNFNDKKIPKGNAELIRKILIKKLHEIGYNAYLGIEARGMTRSAIIGLFDISTIDKIGLYNSKKKDIAKESVISEGKHWPEDYIKTAFNAIKNSELGKQSWYTDNYIHQDLKSIVDEFSPLSHKNSNLGYFATIIKWFIAYAGKDKQKYQEFIERKLDGIIKTLLWLSNNPGEESKLKEQIKTKWALDDFEKYQKEVEDQISKEQSDKLKNVKLEDKGYEIIQINSYEELHEKFGGNKTGYKGDSKWCHTNGSSTYNSWTNGGKYNFFVLAKKDWEKIEPPNPADRTTKAYDEYGTSLIAILVDVASGKLLNATLRWNHVIEPSLEKKGASVDKAFLGWGDLAEVTGKDVEKEIKEKLKDKQEALKKEIEDANRRVNEYLESHKDKLKGKGLNPKTNFKIIQKFKDIITEVRILKGITSIGDRAFAGCSGLTSIVIPDSVTNIMECAFSGCSGLTEITIPDSVTSIGDDAFYGCSGLTSIVIPDGVTSIGKYVFSGCSGLTSVTIPDSVTSIGFCAFCGCSGLTSVTIPDSVTSIGDYAFNGCYELTSITIPAGVTNIGDYAFWFCSKLKTVYCSKKIWNKFRNTFPEEAERKDPKEMKKESLNEAHEIHSYPEKLQPMLERIVKDHEDYELDHAYFNKEGKFIWMRNLKGYFHVFKPVKFVKTPGMTKPFGFKDLILKDNGMLEEIDRLRFVDGNEGLTYLNKKYHLDLKTIK